MHSKMREWLFLVSVGCSLLLCHRWRQILDSWMTSACNSTQLLYMCICTFHRIVWMNAVASFLHATPHSDAISTKHPNIFRSQNNWSKYHFASQIMFGWKQSELGLANWFNRGCAKTKATKWKHTAKFFRSHHCEIGIRMWIRACEILFCVPNDYKLNENEIAKWKRTMQFNGNEIVSQLTRFSCTQSASISFAFARFAPNI